MQTELNNKKLCTGYFESYVGGTNKMLNNIDMYSYISMLYTTDKHTQCVELIILFHQLHELCSLAANDLSNRVQAKEELKHLQPP